MSPAEGFLKYFESCQVSKKFRFVEYFDQQFSNKSPIKYRVKYNNCKESLLLSICNSVLKNLQLNAFFQIMAKEELVDLNLYENLYQLFKEALYKNNDENCLPKLLLYLHMSKGSFSKDAFQDFFQSIISLQLINNDYNSKFDQLKVDELKALYLKLIKNTRVQQCSSDAIQLVNGCRPLNYDYNKLKLYFFTAAFDFISLNGYAGIDSIYISLSELLRFNNTLSDQLNLNAKSTIVKLNFVRIVQHEITHVILRDLADDMNVSTSDVLSKNKFNLVNKEAGILAEVEHYGGRINWIKSSYLVNFNMQYCEYYLRKIEADEYEKFDRKKAGVIEYTNQINFMALDMLNEKLTFVCFE